MVLKLNHNTGGRHLLDECRVGVGRLVAVNIQPNEVEPRESRQDLICAAHLRFVKIDPLRLKYIAIWVNDLAILNLKLARCV